MAREKLEYHIHSCSSFTAAFRPENVLVDTPLDSASRWSGAAIGEGERPSWITLGLQRICVVDSITFGKVAKPHPCDVKDFMVYGGIQPEIEQMTLLLRGTLKNDAIAETFVLGNATNIVPCRYLRIIPLTGHAPNFNLSFWHIALHGTADDTEVEDAHLLSSTIQETNTLKLILKHLRQRGLVDAMNTLAATVAKAPYSVQLEHPLLTRLHDALVVRGDFNTAEAILSQAAMRPRNTILDSEASADDGSPSLFQEYAASSRPKADWVGFAPDSSARPSPRGGHQMVFVPAYGSEPAYIYLFGGYDGEKDLADFWKLKVGTNSWTLLEQDTSANWGPRARSCHKMCLDEESGDIYMLGRFLETEQVAGANLSNDFWVFHTRGSGKWECLSSDVSKTLVNSSSLRLSYDHAMTIDTKRRHLYVSGGKHFGPADSRHAEEMNSICQYHIVQRKWYPMSTVEYSREPGANFMRPRVGHSMVFDSLNDCLWFIGGQVDGIDAMDIWRYDLKRLAWTRVTDNIRTEGGPDNLSIQRASFDPAANQLIILNGSPTITKDSPFTPTTSLWLRDMAKGTWICVQEWSGGGNPEPRNAHQFIRDPSTNIHYLFGGKSANTDDHTRLCDLWHLSLIRPKAETILLRAKFIVRRQRLVELSNAGLFVEGLAFLQTALADVVDHSDSEQAAEYRRCMRHLLQGSLVGGASLTENSAKPAENGWADSDAAMASSQDLSESMLALFNKAAAPASAAWEQRAVVFSQLLEFFPKDMQEPTESLSDFVR